jgi:hypothetical protein
MSTLRILQYNVQKSKNGVLVPLLDGGHDLYDVIAIQEPWLNPLVATTYCPRSCPYTLVFPQEGRARTCIYVNKQIPLSQWHASAEQDYSWVRLELNSGPLTIHNVYSETPRSYETTEWNTPIPRVLEAVQAPGRHLVVGDFNLHHTVWGGPAVSRNHAGAALVVSSLCTGQLELLLEPGTVTREKHQNEPSTLDLALSTPNLTSWVTSCKVVDKHLGSDHKPIEVIIQTGIARTSPQPRRNFKKADVNAVRAGAKWLRLPGQTLANSQDIDSYAEYLVSFTQELIRQTVPNGTPSTQAQAWWTPEISNAITAERRAHRKWTHTHTDRAWDDYTTTAKVKRRLIASAKQAHWRKSVHEASTSTEGIWKIAKWARTKSHLPPEPAKMPDLQWRGAWLNTLSGKVRALCERFYPETEADLQDITDRDFQQDLPGQALAMSQLVADKDIWDIVRKVKPDKCPGADEIPNRFLKAMGEPLVKALQTLITAVFRVSYYPKSFRAARTIVLRKPSKPDYSDPGAWRPIALLSTLGKIIETLAARRLSALAEQEGLLPDSQMGNRKNRSTETALELLVEQVHTIWKAGNQVASVLSLDIAGAFDTVNHIRLLDNLRKKRIPLWFVRMVKSFLTERTTTLLVDGEESAPRQLAAGVPQGSPLSPILFLFYNAPLLEAAYQPELPMLPLGFADDVNLLSYGQSTAITCANLELAHEQCLDWARTHGMRFAPNKYTLTHFTQRKGFDMQAPVRLRETTVQPKPVVRILGLQVDSKLRWKAQGQAIQAKMDTQMLALQRITASTWGATMPKARQIYQAVVRSAMSYGAAVWHQPQSNASKPKGLAAKLQNQQNQGLRTVLGAFKATPIRQLHTESYVPPVDLWLNGRVARFQARTEHSGIAQKIRDACSSIRTRILSRTRRQRRQLASYALANTPGTKRKLWVEEWTGLPLEQWDWQEKKLVLRDWERRWHAEYRKLERIVRPGTDPGDRRAVPEDTPPTKQVLQLHEGLRKAESALLTQARTRKVGLAEFLYKRRVPSVSTATCQCGAGHETPRHMALFCLYEADRRHYLHTGKRRTYTQMVGTNEGAKHFVRWMMFSDRLRQFALAKRLLYDSKQPSLSLTDRQR